MTKKEFIKQCTEAMVQSEDRIIEDNMKFSAEDIEINTASGVYRRRVKIEFDVLLPMENKSGDIRPIEMEDGEIGEITGWSAPKYVGQIVQRIGSSLQVLGQDEGEAWSNIKYLSDACKVRVFESGTMLKIEDGRVVKC